MCTDGGQADKTGTQGTYPISPWHTDSSPPSPPAPALTPGTEAVRLGAAGGWAGAGSSQDPAPPSKGLAEWERAPGFGHPVPAHHPNNSYWSHRVSALRPSSKASWDSCLPYPQSTPGAAPAAPAETSSSGRLGPRRTQVQGGAGQGWAFPTEPNKRTHSRRAYVLASEPRRLVSAASRPLTGCPAPGVPLNPETWGSWEGRECLLCSRGSPQ